MENEMSNSYLTLYDVLFSAVYYCVIYVIYVLIAIACKCFLQINKFIHYQLERENLCGDFDL